MPWRVVTLIIGFVFCWDFSERSATASPPQNDGHIWYSEVRPSLTGKGLSLILNACRQRPSRGSGTTSPKILTDEKAPRLADHLNIALFQLDICLRHAEVEVREFTPPDQRALEAARNRTCTDFNQVAFRWGPKQRPPAQDTHVWYSEVQPESEKGLVLVIPACPREANWAVLNAQEGRRLSADPKTGHLLKATLDGCLVHGEIKVLDHTPPESRLLEGGATRICSNSGFPERE